jgi:hypothetical protein
MNSFFAPVVLPERFDFFRASNKSSLDKRLIDSGNECAGVSFDADKTAQPIHDGSIA